jgi:phage tail-like protein
MDLASVGALVQSGGGLGVLPVTPAYGVAFRFAVDIGGLELGDWQSCSGLKVDFKPAEMKSGGNYLGSHWLAGEASYSRVVLKRGAMQAGSRALQEWLRKQGIAWLNGQDGPDTGGPCTITLFDSSGKPVIWWVLDHARPAAWSGPDLDAGASKVAVETLELVHSGFTVGWGPKAPRSAAPAPSVSSKTQSPSCALTEVNGPGAVGGKTVQFTFPPTEIGVQKRQPKGQHDGRGGRSVDGTEVQVEGTIVDASATTPNITTYVLNNLVLWGPTTRTTVDTLDLWATKTTTKEKGTTKGKDAQPQLSFTWGSGFNGIPVVLKSMSATYTRFTVDGQPIRAKVNLQLEQTGPPPAATGTAPPKTVVAQGAQNPTSGGIPGRASHLFRDMENLPALAQQTYGDPTAWRAVAEANRVDDPLRLVPGTILLLPAPSEIAPSAREAGPR